MTSDKYERCPTCGYQRVASALRKAFLRVLEESDRPLTAWDIWQKLDGEYDEHRIGTMGKTLFVQGRVIRELHDRQYWYGLEKHIKQNRQEAG